MCSSLLAGSSFIQEKLPPDVSVVIESLSLSFPTKLLSSDAAFLARRCPEAGSVLDVHQGSRG